MVRPADDQLRGDDRADAGLVEQLGHERADVVEDLALELVGFRGRGLDPSGERAQHEHDRELVGCARALSGGSGCSVGSAAPPAVAAAPRETARQVCDESRHEGGQAPDQANSGRQTGVAVHARTIHSQGTQTRPDARRVTSGTDDTSLATAPDGPTHRLSQTPDGSCAKNGGSMPSVFTSAAWSARLR